MVTPGCLLMIAFGKIAGQGDTVLSRMRLVGQAKSYIIDDGDGGVVNSVGLTVGFHGFHPVAVVHGYFAFEDPWRDGVRICSSSLSIN